MNQSRFRKVMAATAVAASATMVLAACSGGGKSEASTPAGGAAAAEKTMTIIMVTHQAPGDTFWDRIRKGAEAAAAKDGVDFQYTNDPDATKQAQLIQAAIDKKPDGIAVTDPNTGAIGDAIKKAVAAGIPVSMFNAGGDDALGLGAIGYFGQSESDAGLAVGQKAAGEGAKHILCVIQEQGQSQLEARCDGVTKGAAGAKVERLYVNGRDDSAVTSNIQAKLSADKTIDYVATLGAQFALDAGKAVKSAGSSAKVGTFDLNIDAAQAVKDGKLQFAIDQQPYLQGYLAVDSIWLYKTNGNTIGGGQNVATGPAFIDKTNVDAVAGFAANGTR
jgi:simple sugar transport system substrate-binding protein